MIKYKDRELYYNSIKENIIEMLTDIVPTSSKTTDLHAIELSISESLKKVEILPEESLELWKTNLELEVLEYFKI